MTDADLPASGPEAHLRVIANDRFLRFAWIIVGEQMIELGRGGTFGLGVAIHAACVLLAIGWFARFAKHATVRFAHARLLLLWWIPVAGTLLQQTREGVGVGVPVLFVEIVCVVLLVNSRSASGSLLLAMACEIALIGVDAPPLAGLYISVLSTAAIVGIAFQVTVRRSLVRAEVMRRAALESQRELEGRMEELKLTEVERKHLQERLFHAQRLQAIGTLAAGLAHDMNNVLGGISMSAETSLLDARTDEVTSLKRIIDASARGGGLTRDLLSYSQRGQYRKETVAVRTVLEEAIAIARGARDATTSYELIIEENCAFLGDRARLGQAIVNLCVNASDAMDGSGTVRVIVDSVNIDAAQAISKDVRAGGFVRISVQDTGHGIDAETSRRIFEPFFTTKAAGRGTGLGLAMVWGVTRAHGGTVTVVANAARGTTFEVLIPVATERQAGAATLQLTPARTILIVDDEPAVRATTQRMLARCGYESITAEDGAVALRLFDEHRGSIGLVILDMGMPVMGGRECFRQLRTRSDVPVFIATGYAVDEEIQELVQQGALLLEKPYSAADLRQHVGALVSIRSTASGSPT